MASVADLEARKAELETEIREIDAEYAGDMLPDDVRDTWNDKNEERDQIVKTIKELDLRRERVAELAGREQNTERPVTRVDRNRNRNRVPDDPTQIEEYRNLSSSIDDLDQAYTDGAKVILERRFRPAHPGITTEQAQDNIARLLDTIDRGRGERSIARRIIATSSPGYEREFGTFLATQGRVVGKEMERTASLTTTAGGYAVPVILDPSVILVSSGVVNPVRQLARVVQVTGNTWEGITSTGITASYGAEVTTATDNAPVLVQPTANVEKAQAFVPMSIEVSEDWAAIQSEMAMMFQDAKDTLESAKFLTGVGHAAIEPQGLIATGGSTAVVTSASTAVIAAVDLYSLEAALQPRWRQRASIVGNKAFFQKVRQLDTSGGANLWVQLQNSNPPTLIGYPAYEWSDYSALTTTSGSTVATIGDFNQFLIVDRVGMSVEFIPHLFGGSSVTHYPTGQRALYMYWRNTSKVLTPGSSANSAFISLKLL